MTTLQIHGQSVTVGDCWTVFTFQGLRWTLKMGRQGLYAVPAIKALTDEPEPE